MIDLSDRETWFSKSTSKAITFEYIDEYDLSDREIDAVYRYICSYLFAALFEEFKIKDDPVDYVLRMYHGEKGMVPYLAEKRPDLFDNKIFKMELLGKDRERVIEDYYLMTVVEDLARKYEYDRYEETLEDTFMYLVNDKEYNLNMVRESLLKQKKTEPLS